ncbi:MAG TPA: S53 family peptidase [Actinocrinis sp.]|nr:S53 family peptidase [Actinocrinis sp.]
MPTTSSPLRAKAVRRRALAAGSVTALALSALPALSAAAALPAPAASPVSATLAAAAALDAVTPVPASAGHILVEGIKGDPVSTTACETTYTLACYSPVQYRRAYDLNPLYARGVTGAGRTIVIVDSFGSPTIQNDLDTFDAHWGLPNTHVQVVKSGTVPPFSSTDASMDSWAYETSLDVEYAHSVAPGATIVLLETGVAETEGTTGFAEIMAGEKHLIDQGVGDVISQSFGATENTFPGFAQGDYSSLLGLRGAFADAATRGVSVLAASGDAGATDAQLDGQDFAYRVADWPPSDPLVTAVGGTRLSLDDAGNRVQPDTVWNDGYGAGGGGVSAVFARPGFQAAVSSVVGARRGYPDISMSGAVNGSAWVYTSYDPTEAGWSLVGGTSEATPIFAGIVALADQYAGHRLGDINAALYSLGRWSRTGLGARTGIVDVTTGNNSYQGVTGYQAGPGYDLASGWGTVDAARFVPALAQY